MSFEIFPISVAAGQIALSPIPGRSGAYEADLSTLLHWGPDLVLTMTTRTELDRMGASGLGADLQSVGIEWRHLPIIDFGAPDKAVRDAWPSVSTQAAAILNAGGKILTHCFGGCGRSGMIALRLMVEVGEDPHAALKRLRQVRPCAVEREGQFDWAAQGA